MAESFRKSSFLDKLQPQGLKVLPRYLIVPNGSVTHCFFRCHNRQMLFKNNSIKRSIVRLWAKYRKRYGIEIHEFIIMDNHCHMIVKSGNVENLGNFMRTVNAQIARIVNRSLGRDSQVIRDRYKSPIISNRKYLAECIQYIYLNRFKIDKCSDPKLDVYCSAAWRFNSKVPQLFVDVDDKPEMIEAIYSLLERPSGLGVLSSKNSSKSVVDLLNAAMSKVATLKKSVFDHTHTIADQDVVQRRKEYLSTVRKGGVAFEL